MKTSHPRKLTAAIIGTGRVGTYHMLGQLAVGSRVVLYNPSVELAQALAANREHVTVAESLDQAIESADVVHICTPPKDHLEAALKSIAQSKPTIIEKPLAFKLDDAVKIYLAATIHGRPPVIAATSFRIGPSATAIYDGLRADKIGELGSLESTYVHDTKNLEPGKSWRKQLEGNAFLYEGGTHAVDLNMWFADQPVKAVQAMVSHKKTRTEYRWNEDFAVNLLYEDGLVGRVWVNAASPLPQHGSSMAVYGSTGAYRAHSKEPYYESYLEGDTNWQRHPIDGRHTMITMQLMAAVFNDYLQGKRADFKPMPDITEGLRVMIVLNTIEKSLQTGNTELVPTLEDIVSRVKKAGVTV
jgi:predicted dehydrogenase